MTSQPSARSQGELLRVSFFPIQRTCASLEQFLESLFFLSSLFTPLIEVSGGGSLKLNVTVFPTSCNSWDDFS